MENVSRKKVIVVVILFLVLVVLGVIALVLAAHKSGTQNQFGGYIKIQNYDQKIKNISTSVKDSIETSLFNTVKMNSVSGFDPSTVKDAYIRESSDVQDNDTTTRVISGNFIVDMPAIKQSYFAQYAYSESNTIDTGGSPVIITCLPKEQLKYGEFKCTDLASKQSSTNDAILQYLPIETYSYTISPDATTGSALLVLDVVLTIPDSDLRGDASSRAQVVAQYKSQVTDWITSKGLDTKKYIIKYNYTAAGDFLGDSKFQ